MVRGPPRGGQRAGVPGSPHRPPLGSIVVVDRPVGRPPLRLALAVAGVVAAVGMAAVAWSRHDGGGAGAGAPGPVVTGAGVRVGSAPPEVRGTALDGAAVDLAALRGRVVLVNFFATWCLPCRDELPLLEARARRDGGRGLSVVAVYHSDGGDVRGFLRDHGFTQPALLDPDDAVGRAFAIEDLPTTVALGRDGRVAAVFHGELTAERLDAALATLLG